MISVDRWAGWLGSVAAAWSLGLVALADLGWFRAEAALAVILATAVVAALVWRPWTAAPRPRRREAALAGAILLAGALLIAPGSESVVGPRDPGVYVATGFAIARWGSTTIHDPGLELLADAMDPSDINSWLYENALNHARIRFPTQLFIRDVDRGIVEAGFLPVLPVWIAVAATLGGVEAALHVAGVFGVLSLAFAMLACAATGRSVSKDGEREGDVAALSGFLPSWPLAGVMLALAFSQVWWAREPMAEAALGAVSWLVAWASVRWIGGGGWRWAALGAVGASAALFTRADGILLLGAFALVTALLARSDRLVAVAILAPGVVLAGLHYALVAPIYMSTSYGAFTFGRAIGGIVVVSAVVTALAAIAWVRRSSPPSILRVVVLGRRVIVFGVIGVGLASAVSGFAPGLGREATVGAVSPLAWLTGYIPWPLLLLAALGFGALGWWGAPRAFVPLLLVGGLPALLYLPDPLVTGDHPWMVRRLVPAVVPLIAMLASTGAVALARVEPPWAPARGRGLGAMAASVLVGLGLALQVAMDRDLFGPRHAAGAVAGVEELAKALPPGAFVVFPSGQAGIHMVLPLGYVFGVDAFAVPRATMTEEIAGALGRIAAAGRPVYWVDEGAGPPSVPPGTRVQPIGSIRIRYMTADGGKRPPPLDLLPIEHLVTVHRVILE